ncbi:MAG: hypothetical protein FJX76_02775 [Armatimonadetes bacterium]|nr:hypothetical protein [Armatimonadota bacterium]
MQPIVPVGQTGSQVAAVTEAVVRYGVSEELKDAQRREAPPDPGASSDGLRIPVERIELSSASEHSEGPHGPAPGQDGMKEQQEQALAQHAAEQHRRADLRWTDARHTQRSTREQVHNVEHASETASTEKGEAPKDGPHGAAPAAGQGGKPAASGGHGSMSAGLGADVIAAAVNSGVCSADAIADDERRGFELDDTAEQMDSSDQATSTRLAQQGKRLDDRREMNSSLGFGKDQDDQQRQAPGGFQQGGGSDDHEQPRREPPAQAEGTPAGEPTPVEPRDVAERVSQPPVEPPRAEQTPSVQPVSTKTVEAVASDADKVDRTATLSPGAEAVGSDEYFFFDDARFSPDAA